jgi:hypothetical protein
MMSIHLSHTVTPFSEAASITLPALFGSGKVIEVIKLHFRLCLIAIISWIVGWIVARLYCQNYFEQSQLI